jgi:hypothetical protein
MISKKLKEFKQRFESETQKNGLPPIFEIEVIDKRTKETDYIIFDVFVKNSFFIARHVSLTAREERSKKIAFKRTKIDPDFSIDENMYDLYSTCIDAIIESEFYELPKN